MNLKKAIHIILDEVILAAIDGKTLTAQQNEAMAYLRTIQFAPVDLSNLDDLIDQYHHSGQV